MDAAGARTFGSRFIFTFGANVFKALVGFATGLLVARGLGPHEYGTLAFLLGTFIGIRQLLDMGASTAFFTFLSQRPRSRIYVARYLGWLVVVQFFVPLLLMGILFPDRSIELIWKGERRDVVLLAFVASFMQGSLWTAVVQMAESQRLTRWVQAIGVGITCAHFLAACLLWYFSELRLYWILLALAVEYFAASWLAGSRLTFETTSNATDTGVQMLREFRHYCLPLVPYSIASFGYEFADRWLLQNFGGSVEQAYYAVGAQFAGIAMIATSSILNVFWKEVAEAHHHGDMPTVAKLYRRVSRLLFLAGAAMAGFLIPWSESLLHFFLGEKYAEGATALAIMFLYPVHQSMGQIGGATLYATGRVKLQATSGLIFMIASIVASYFVLAPASAGIAGLGLASAGMALKMVVMQILVVNAIAYFISKSLHHPFDWLHQVVSLAIGGFGGWLSRELVHSVGTLDLISLPAQMVVAGLVYLVYIAAILHALPWLADADRIRFFKIKFRP